jgi:hypothetical protein
MALPRRSPGLFLVWESEAAAPTSFDSPGAREFMHIVTIRRNGVVDGFQLRTDGCGPGATRFFASRKYGGAEEARKTAQAMAAELRLPETGPRGGSPEGRVTRLSRTGAAGIRFVWKHRPGGSASLAVVATWTDKLGRPRSTCYSVERNGLNGALEKAIAARKSCGAPVPARPGLLAKLRAEYETARAGVSN